MDIEEYARRHRHFFGLEVPPLLEARLRSVRPSRLMDLGCGDGALLHALKRLGLLDGVQVFAVDGSAERIKRVGTIDPGFVCVVDSACRLASFDEASVDFVISTQVIEHVADDAEMIRQVRRVLAPDGMLYLTTVFRGKWAWYFYRNRGRWVLDPTHVREYENESDLMDILRREGFELLDSRMTPICYAPADVLARRASKRRPGAPPGRLLSLLRMFRVPIPGYRNWELLCRRAALRTANFALRTSHPELAS